MIGKRAKILSNDWKLPAVALALALLAFLLFWPTTRYEFIELDDSRYVRDNTNVTTGLSWDNIHWAFSSAHEQWYLPLLWLSFMADSHFFGTAPSVYHRTNVLLHITNVLLLFLVLVRMTGSVWRSALVAALFAVHPTRVEAVAWVTARKDTLSGLFFMLGLWSYAGYVERKSPWRMGLVTLWLGLGLLAKSILVVFPFCLMLLDYWPLRRVTGWRPLILEKLPLLALAVFFVLVTLSTHETGRGDFTNIPLIDRFTFIPPNVWQYLQLVFYPVNLALVYPEHDYLNWFRFIMSSGGLLLVTYAAWRYRKQAPYLIIGWLWFLVALGPILRGVRLGLASHTDRFTYLPFIGLAFAFTWAAADWAPRWKWRAPVLGAAAIALVLVCWAGARAYLPYWRNSETLFLQTIDRTERNYLIHVNLAAVYNAQGRVDEEIAVLHRALSINPRSTVSMVGMGAALRGRGLQAEATAYIDEAAGLVHSREWQVHLKIGEHYALTGRFDEAIHHFEQVLRENPGYIDAHHNIGMCHLYSRRPREALDHFEIVVAHDPDYERAHWGMSRALGALQRYDEAVESLRAAMRLAPDREEYRLAMEMLTAEAQRVVQERVSPEHTNE